MEKTIHIFKARLLPVQVVSLIAFSALFLGVGILLKESISVLLTQWVLLLIPVMWLTQSSLKTIIVSPDGIKQQGIIYARRNHFDFQLGYKDIQRLTLIKSGLPSQILLVITTVSTKKYHIISRFYPDFSALIAAVECYTPIEKHGFDLKTLNRRSHLLFVIMMGLLVFTAFGGTLFILYC